MKFELTAAHKQYSDSVLLGNLKLVAKTLNKGSLKIRDYSKKNGAEFSYQTLKKRFGSWKDALEKAGLRTEESIHGVVYGESKIKESRLIDDMKLVAAKVGGSLTINAYTTYGKYGASAICKRFGGWNKAKLKAGLQVGRRYNSSDDEYFKNLEEVWQKLGRQPRYQEMIKPLSQFHISSYENHFGSWRRALEEFIKYIDRFPGADVSNDSEPAKSSPKTKVDILHSDSSQVNYILKKRTNRGINSRLRFIVMRRDNFKCKSCGRSPATDLGVILHVDHIKAWAKGGETVLENLQTLCSKCNIGKSDLD